MRMSVEGGSAVIVSPEQPTSGPTRLLSGFSSPRKSATFLVTGRARSKGSQTSGPTSTKAGADASYAASIATSLQPTASQQQAILHSGPGIPEYIYECNRTGVIPISFFMRHVKDDMFVMRYRALGPLGAKALSVPLEENIYIKHLDLEGNCIGSMGGLYLASSLRDNEHIIKLILSENGLQRNGACAIVEMMRENKHITDLDISDNGLSDSDGRIFYILLKHNHTLKRLALRNNRLGENTAEWLEEAFELNDTLTVLDLGWNHFRHRSAIILADIIRENSSLIELHLTMNGLGLEGAGAMAEALEQNSTLEFLDVSANRIVTEGAFEIAKALETNQTLKTLMIGNNPITPEGALTLITAIDNNKQSAMTLLHMKAVMVTDEFELLQKKLAKERNLQVVHGGVLGGHRMMKARAVAKERAQLDSLELKYRSNPLTKLRDYCDSRHVRLVDLFRQFDRDQSWSLTTEELVKGVKSSGIDMDEKEIAQLIRMLDVDGNGELDYQEVAFGVARNQEEKLKIARWNQEMREKEATYQEELKTLLSQKNT